MRDYSYNDMLRMQQEAAERVREMKKRAAIVVDDETPQKKDIKPIPDKVRHISYPVEISNNEDDCNDETDGIPSDGHKGLISLLSEDKDALLVLSLAFILSQEKEDLVTTLALFYLLL